MLIKFTIFTVSNSYITTLNDTTKSYEYIIQQSVRNNYKKFKIIQLSNINALKRSTIPTWEHCSNYT